MDVEPEKIKELFTDKTGRDLITCMLLVQPITRRELQYFFGTLFQLYNVNVSKNHDFRRDMLRVPKEIPIFSKSTLDQRGRAFLKAVDAGLIVKIHENDRERNNFYMINSNLRFQINDILSAKNPLKIDVYKNSKSHSTTHKINIDMNKYINPIKKLFKDYKINNIKSNDDLIKSIFTQQKKLHAQDILKKSNEKIALPNEGIFKPYSRESIPHFDSVKEVIKLFHWLCCPIRRNFLIDYIEKADKFGIVEKNKLSADTRKNEYLQKEAIENDILFLVHKKSSEYQLSNSFMSLKNNKQSIELFLTRSYNPLSCFSNYKQHLDEIEKGVSPFDLMNILTDDNNYKIIPKKRENLVFSSILYKPSYFNKLKELILQEWVENKNYYISLRNTACINRDVFDITPGIYSILNSVKNFSPKTKLIIRNYAYGGGFLFSQDMI